MEPPASLLPMTDHTSKDFDEAIERARDLRLLMAPQTVTTDLERIGDHAKN